MKKNDIIIAKIRLQGAPIINKQPGFIHTCNANFAIIEFQLKTKRCEIEAMTGGDGEAPGLIIGATKSSVSINKRYTVNDPTIIEFPTLKGWDIFISQTFKSSLRVCFKKI